MAAEGGNNIIIRYNYRGEEGEVIPREATHIFVVDKDVTFVRARAFREHPNIIELVCHDKVEKIEEYAFFKCPSLRRVIMPGVKIVEQQAFEQCIELTDVECGKLEIIGEEAFYCCKILKSINLPSARVVKLGAFEKCYALMGVKFGRMLEKIEESVFHYCLSLERITIPLKDSLITTDDIFTQCQNLRNVDLVESAELHETTAALQLKAWRNDMNEEIDSINLILLNAPAGYYATNLGVGWLVGEKARAIRRWIRSLLGKYVHYRVAHQRVLNEAAATLQFALPRGILMNNVLPFLELPSNTFEGAQDYEMKQGELVRYCSDECQEEHRPQRKEDCMKHPAELYDELLFKQPESSYLGDCPICYLPLPIDSSNKFMACCSKVLCDGCNVANQNREVEGRLQHKCPFCRTPMPSTQEEIIGQWMQRVYAENPFAMCQMGTRRYRGGDYEAAFGYWSMAADLGDAEAHFNLSCLYMHKDKIWELYHLKKASIGGHPHARLNLGYYEEANGRLDRAAKHFIIAAKLGVDESLECVKNAYKAGYVSKEDFASALRGHQAVVNASKSPQREEAYEFLAR